MGVDVGHVGPAGLPGLEVEIDFHPRLLLAERVRHVDDDRRLVLDLDLAIGAPQELEQVVPCFRWHLNLHPQSALRVGDFGGFVQFEVETAATACAVGTLTAWAS